mgnify:CR=1 FL=1
MTYQEILKKATSEHWATGHFNFSESDQARAICEAAKEVGTCAILGTSEGEAKHLGYLEAVALRDAFRKELDISVFLNCDHHKSIESAKKAVNAGYDSIHIDLSAEEFEKNIAGTKEVVDYSRKLAGENGIIISVEGEKTLIPYKGEIEPIIRSFLGSLASGMTYLGAKEMKNIIGKADFIEITNSGIEESSAHGISKQ